ncbi:MAG: hypothetical protein KatS3mg115_2661 [Candidatus Poribacteria bacterium]|nr:MAG: hypothetical protein KatS3mg115_2661 [Candidatus Poribacteria bacterium]
MFRYAFQPVALCYPMVAPPPLNGRLEGWEERHRLPHWSLEGGEELFAVVWVAWDLDHLYLAAQVNLRRPPRINPHRYWLGDCFEVFLDLRGELRHNRFTEHCHHFYALPPGREGRVAFGRCEPGVEHTVQSPNVQGVRTAGESFPQGYRIEVALSREALPTYRPEAHRRIGFDYLVRDAAGRVQFWSAGLELHPYRDPSTWGLLQLTGE